MINLCLENASVDLILEGLSLLGEDAQIDADEGRHVNIANVADEIKRQKNRQKGAP